MTDLAPLLAATRDIAAALAVPVRKSADGEVDAYAGELERFVNQGLSGDMDLLDLRRAHRALLEEYGPAVYIASLEDCGVPEEDMTGEDDDAISGWVTDQKGYVSDFAQAVIDARGDDLAAEAVRGRVDTWAASARALATLACMSAKQNQAVTWKYGETEAHCSTCASLNGKRHRMSWFIERDYIPQQPGAAMECGGWRCLCTLTDSEGNQVAP